MGQVFVAKFLFSFLFTGHVCGVLMTAVHGVSKQRSPAATGLVPRGISRPRVYRRDKEGGIKTKTAIGCSLETQNSFKGACSSVYIETIA